MSHYFSSNTGQGSIWPAKAILLALYWQNWLEFAPQDTNKGAMWPADKNSCPPLTLTNLFECLYDKLLPPFEWVVALETVIRNVVGEEVEEALGVEVVAELDVVLLSGDHSEVLLLLAAVLAEFDASNVLEMCHMFSKLLKNYFVTLWTDSLCFFISDI